MVETQTHSGDMSDIKGVENQTDADQEESNRHDTADDRPCDALRQLCAELRTDQYPHT